MDDSTTATLAARGQQSQTMADDASFVIDVLAELDDGTRGSTFKDRLDMDRLGMAGHSLGGSAAYILAFYDSRVKAAIDLDGGIWTEVPDGTVPAPFLMISSDGGMADSIVNGLDEMCGLEDMSEEERSAELEAYDGNERAFAAECERVAGYNQRDLRDVLATSETLYAIGGSSHMSFSDTPSFIGFEWLREMLGMGGRTDPGRILEITQAVTLTFFDQHLKGDQTVTLDSLVVRYAELQHVEL